MAVAASLFLIFTRVILMAFGGVFSVMPELERLIVQEHSWLTHEQFMQSFVLGQFLPGPNMAMGSILGYWIGGGKGFLAAFGAICTVPLILMGITQRLYDRYQGLPWVRRLELAMRPIVVGLLVASLLKLGVDQAVGQAVGQGARVWEIRLAALVLILVGGYFHRWRKVSSLKVIFSSGLVWLALNRLV